MNSLQTVILRTVHASVEDPTIFVIVTRYHGERQYFARDLVTHRAVRSDDETVVGTVWRGAFTPKPSLVS